MISSTTSCLPIHVKVLQVADSPVINGSPGYGPSWKPGNPIIGHRYASAPPPGVSLAVAGASLLSSTYS